MTAINWHKIAGLGVAIITGCIVDAVVGIGGVGVGAAVAYQFAQSQPCI